jgi:putative flavoprotein involved in K+ transport
MNDNNIHDAVVIGGGQSGLAAAWALRQRGLAPIVLEAGADPVGSWPHYYDSLTLFSPARYSSLPGMAFPGDPAHYPHRDEVIDYLRAYAKTLDAEIRTTTRATAVHQTREIFTVLTDDGQDIATPRVIAATGGFARPYLPDLPGLSTFTGRVLHASDYHTPTALAGQRVVVVGAGNSAVQIAVELAEHAQVSLATRNPVKYVRQRPLGRDMHFWFKVSGIDTAPIGPWIGDPPTAPVFDTGRYRNAVNLGRPDHRPMFGSIEGDEIVWADGNREHLDVLLLATGYRPDLDYLAPLGALDETAHPRQRRGLSTTHPGLAYVGLEWQRSLSSASLRGVGRDAIYLAKRLP